MGLAISSSSVKNTINSLTSVVNTTTSNVIQNADTTCDAVNTFTGFFGIFPSSISPDGTVTTAVCTPPATVEGGGVNITQNANNTCSLKEGLTQEINDQITNELSTNINQWLKSNATANNGFLGFGISIAESQGINDVQLSNMIANTLTSNLDQTCKTVLNASNVGKVYFCGDYPDGINIIQNAVNSNLTSCIINNTITAITNNEVLNDIVQKAAVEANASNEGIGSLFGWLKWLILAGVILAALIIIGVLLYFIFGSKGSTPAPGASKTQQQIKEGLERRLLEKKEGGIGSSSKLKEFERLAENRVK